MNNQLLEKFEQILPAGSILLQEPLKGHTTFRIGGPADYLLDIQTVAQLQEMILLLEEEQIPYFLLGNGSNLLVSDKGYAGVVLRLSGEFATSTVQEREITAGAGVILASVARLAASHGLTGMEFASGIPGTVGGAMVMNAGAYGGEMSQVVKSAVLMTPEGELFTVTGEEMAFGYRTSRLKNGKDILLFTTLSLQPGEQEKIENTMRELAQKRREKQPLEYPSAGSTFKRPEGNFAGKLIMEAGLRGFQVGGAQVAEKHCGFVINKEQATARDVVMLMEQVQKRVYEQTGIWLEKEIILLGEFDTQKNGD